MTMEAPPEDLVLRIYDSVADPALWPGILQEVAERVGARGCLILEREKTKPRIALSHASSSYDLEITNGYLKYFGELEHQDHERFAAASLHDDGIDIVGDEILYEDRNEFMRRPNVRAVVEYGLLHRAAAYLNKDNTLVDRFAVQFADTRGPITAEERARLNPLLPHIAKALHLGRPALEVARLQEALLTGMERLNIGFCVLDDKGRVVAKNEEFARQLDEYSVMGQDQSGALRFSRPEDQRTFEHLKSDARVHGRFGGRPRKEAISIREEDFLCIEVAPLGRSEALGTAPLNGLIVHSADTSRPVHVDASPMQAVYGLTGAETSLAALIVEGLTNAQIAERRGRAVPTVNAQVKSILAKTNCATRTQFVRLMIGFGASYLRPEAQG